jgi:hypothetical protein
MNTRVDLFFKQLQYFPVTLFTNANAAHGIDAVFARVWQGGFFLNSKPPFFYGRRSFLGT